MSKTSLTVLQMLASGESLSGEAIGEVLGISRMAISKAIKSLSSQGLCLSSIPGKGYQLDSPIDLLEQNTIDAALTGTGYQACQVEVLQQIDSTSEYLLDQSKQRDIHGSICLAESQTSGRGRRQRAWHASPYRNVLLSIGWRFDDGMSALSGLSIAAGLTIARTLHAAGFDKDIGLKWPNDIVCKDSKLGGLLIDVRGEHDGPCLAVLGLGLNIELSGKDLKNIDQPCISLEDLSSQSIDRNALVIDLIRALTDLFSRYSSSGFKAFHLAWQEYDRLYNREVKVMRGEEVLSGIAMGIDESGALLVDEGKESYTRFLSGDVSLRLAQ